MHAGLKDNIVEWLREMVAISGARGLVVGMSGGIDSSLTAVIAKEAFPSDSLGLILPCHSVAEDRRLALMVAEKFGIRARVIELDAIYDGLLGAVRLPAEAAVSARLAEANLKPRLRMAVFYYHANSLKYLVCGTANKSEMMLGYFTKHGDDSVDLMPLGGLLKEEVRKLADEAGLPREIIDRPPTAGLWEGQTDERELGLSYEKIDEYLRGMMAGRRREVNRSEAERIIGYISQSTHKREKPPVFVPGGHVLSQGRNG
jgi:NAD+ synthase